MSPEAVQYALDMIETLRQVESRAAKVVKVDDLVALISHEFRNPINAVMNHLLLLSQGEYGELSAPQDEIVSQLCGEMAMLSNLTHVVSDLAHSERAKRRIKFSEVSVPTLVETLEAEMQVVCTTSKVGFRKAIQWGVGEVWSEPVRLQMALRNILLYAARVLARTSVVLEASASEDGTEFTVRADGAVGDPESLLQPAAAESGGGMGIYLSERLVELIDGRLRVTSAGNSTCFQIVIPERAYEASR